MKPDDESQGWTSRPLHRSWLRAEGGRLLDFGVASRDPGGGFGWLDDTGRPLAGRPVQAWITTRMTHCYALAHLLGRPGAGPLVDHGVAALQGLLRDREHGGWLSEAGGGGDKRAYEHAFVVLAAASATVADRPGAQDLLADALDVVESRFWDDDSGLVRDVWDRDWSHLEAYRGANANMHMVEALLAAGDATGDGVWHERAQLIVERIVHGFARENDWMLPEHFDEGWRPLWDYNREEPAHPFRPYGVTIGHLLEWARLAMHVAAVSGPEAPAWLLADAQALFDTAVRVGWSVDGGTGFVYTVDWDGAPVVRTRLHWVVAEGIAAAAVLYGATGDAGYERWYRQWWDHAATTFLDPAGSWRHELDPQLRPSATVWTGRPDVYHAYQATLIPLLPLTPSLARGCITPDPAAPPPG